MHYHNRRLYTIKTLKLQLHVSTLFGSFSRSTHNTYKGYDVAQLVEALRYIVGKAAGSNPDGVIGIFH
jgi:hypothetical protein